MGFEVLYVGKANIHVIPVHESQMETNTCPSAGVSPASSPTKYLGRTPMDRFNLYMNYALSQ